MPGVELNERSSVEPAQGGGLAHIAEPLRPLAVPVDSLTLDPANARKHPEKNLEAIKASLRRFGQRAPLVVQREGMVVRAGNGRLMAAKALGWQYVAAIVVDESAIDATAFAIADNRTSDLAEWDDDTLAKLLESLPSDVREDAGFSDDDMRELLNSLNDGEVVEDEAPEPLPEPVSRRGDLWLMGGHRLLCGDSTDGGDVALVMNGERATCVFTDPPYGVSIGAKNRLLNSVQPAGRCLEDITDDRLSPEQLEETLLKAFVSLRENVMSDDCSLFVCSPQGCGLSMMMMMMMMQKAGLKARHVLIWVKNQPTFSMGRLDYDYQHEPILLTWLDRHKRPMLGEHRSSVWKIDKPRASPDHPTMKPVALYANAYLNNSELGDIVSDIYAGSGTAFVAAEQTNRRCFAIEIEPRYVDVAVRRWQKLTGKQATHADTGKTWEETAAERGVKIE